MLNVEKWPNITARFLRYAWPFFNIMHERIKVHMLEWKHDKHIFQVSSVVGENVRNFCIGCGYQKPTKGDIITVHKKLLKFDNFYQRKIPGSHIFIFIFSSYFPDTAVFINR